MTERVFVQGDGRHVAWTMVSPSILLLLGLSAETGLKGLVVNSSPQLLQALPSYPVELNGHRLLEMLPRSGMALKEEDKDVLRHLSDCTEWIGRYPVPKALTKKVPFDLNTVAFAVRAEMVVASILSRLEDALEAGWVFRSESKDYEVKPQWLGETVARGVLVRGPRKLSPDDGPSSLHIEIRTPSR